MRAQHQTTMTVHVRKLNRGMKQSTILKQAKQQKPIKIKQIESKSKKSKSKSKIESTGGPWTAPVPDSF
jgi:hypothetical protein